MGLLDLAGIRSKIESCKILNIQGYKVVSLWHDKFRFEWYAWAIYLKSKEIFCSENEKHSTWQSSEIWWNTENV